MEGSLCFMIYVRFRFDPSLREFAVFKKKMSSMKRKADETNKTMEETIAQQSTLIQTQNLTIQAQVRIEEYPYLTRGRRRRRRRSKWEKDD